jgi:hypothetical protein
MAKVNVQDVFRDLAKYYGLVRNDAYLQAAGAAPSGGSGGSNTDDNRSKVFSELLGNPSLGFRRSQDIFKLLDGNTDVIVTPFDDSQKSAAKNVTLNKFAGKGKPGQGAEGAGNKLSAGKEFLLNDDLSLSTANPINVFQVLPAAHSPDATDTDIIALYLNSITTLQMSRAVPYLDVSISIKGAGGDDKRFSNPPSLSLGRFLGAGEDDKFANAKFDNDPQAGIVRDQKMQTVASMEIFTSPQTLVNASRENVQYDEALVGPKAIDAFRPFLSLNSVSFSSVPTGFGLINKKTAQVSLTLFDRGRLAEISELVSPQRNGPVQFNMTWGWSHPAGLEISRLSDANATDRIGQLIDSMKVTETFVVVNNSYSLQQDGTVQIELTLASAPLAVSTDTNFNVFESSEAEAAIRDVASLLDGIKNKIKILQGTQKVPAELNQKIAIVPDDIDAVLRLDKDGLKKLQELQSFLNRQGKKGYEDIAADLASLTSNKGRAQSIKVVREKQLASWIKSLSRTPDPFFRSSRGVPRSKNYVSLGKVIVSLLNTVSKKDDAELQVVFGAFNAHAAGMYDHNISQFPILLRGKGSLEEVLKSYVKKQGSEISMAGVFMEIGSKFIQFDGSAAYGLSGLYVPNARDKEGKPVHTDQAKKQKQKKDVNVLLEEELRRIYGKRRSSIDFKSPAVMLTMTTKIALGNAGEGAPKNVTRVVLHDRAGGGASTFIEAYSDMLSTNVFLDNNFGSEHPLSAHHEKAHNAIMQSLRDKKLVKPIKEVVTDKPAGVNEERWGNMYVLHFNEARKTLRDVFFEFSPVLVYGSETSGITNASLSSQQNDALTAIHLVRAINGAADDPDGTRNHNLPRFVMPTQLKLTTFGCPMFRSGQKFFIDFGTFTTADNFYAVTSFSHKIGPGEFTTDVDLVLQDAFGKFINMNEEAEKVIVQAAIAAADEK